MLLKKATFTYTPPMRLLFIFLLSFLCVSCGSDGVGQGGRIRIGVDPTWTPLDFAELQPYVNGYVEDLLLEVSRSSGVEFEKVQANGDVLLEGLRKGQYDALLTSLPPYTFNQAKYDFSVDFLQLGPVLIGTSDSKYSELEDLSGKLVGLISGDPAVLVIEKYPEIIVRNFASIPELFDALVDGEIEGAVVDRLPAIQYVNDLYNGKIHVVSQPLTETGLHLISPKGKSLPLIRAFDKSIKQMKKKEKLTSLQKKWNLE